MYFNFVLVKEKFLWVVGKEDVGVVFCYDCLFIMKYGVNIYVGCWVICCWWGNICVN